MSEDQEQNQEFLRRVEQETKLLDTFIKEGNTLDNNHMGYELEGWLVGNDFSPTANSHNLIKNLNHQQIVPEISRYNFEINGSPFLRDKDILKNTAEDINKLWNVCQQGANELKSQILMIGSNPTVTSSMLTMDVLSPGDRYEKLCQDIMRLRKNRPLKLHISGKELLIKDDVGVITEGSATSYQIHFGCDANNFKNFFNASILASPFSVAVAANSPFLFGHELWDETRIPIFQQAADVNGNTDEYGNHTKRVSFSNGYLQTSVINLFERNLRNHPPMLTELFNSRPEEFKHLMFHNGTIWRWNRPIIGFGDNGLPHFRIEHRVPPAGPTVDDMVANQALYLGMVLHFSKIKENLYELLPFEDLRYNFYQCGRKSLKAKIMWIDGKDYPIQKLLLEQILPQAKQELIDSGVDKDQVEYYLGEVMYNRILTFQNGADWQKSYVAKHGKNFQEMIHTYHQYQLEGTPVWKWKV